MIQALATETGLPALVCAVLANRGLDTSAEIRQFLSEDNELESPFALADMDKAVARILEAVENGERIAVYGDYDCDGVTATALLCSYLQSVGAYAIYYIPSREKEGYGLNRGAVDILHGQRIDLIVTVDNGVSAHDEIDYAASLGIDVVVTDHHTPRETLPQAVAVVNPHRRDCPSRFKELSGVGVAFKLAAALEHADPAELLEYYSELVTLGTVADVVPLTGENRAIVRHGLARLSQSHNEGIRALIRVGGLEGRDIGCEAVAFGIVPRINVAGRLGTVDELVEMLLCEDQGYADETAAELNAMNARRKSIEDEIFAEIAAMLAEQPGLRNGRLLVLSGNGWHHGVIGIVASKVVERYGKPCVLLSVEGGIARGSGRSVEGFSLIEAIAACSRHLTRFGGHTLAAGMTMPAEAIEEFAADMQEFARKFYPRMPDAAIRIDCVLTPETFTLESFQALSRLEPFGAGNEQPLFLLRGAVLEGIYPTADGKHLRLRILFGRSSYYAICFRMTENRFPYAAGDSIDLVCEISAGEYNGKPQLSVRVRDIRPHGADQEDILEGQSLYEKYLRGEKLCADEIAKLTPTRDDIAAVYKYLRKCGSFRYGETALFFRLRAAGIPFGRLLCALDILREMELILLEAGDGDGSYRVVEQPQKVDLGRSKILSALSS